MSLLPGINLTIIALSIFMLIRNHFVFREIRRLLQQVSMLAIQEIERGKDFKWLYNSFNSKSYARMLFENPFRFKWDLKYFGIQDENLR